MLNIFLFLSIILEERNKFSSYISQNIERNITVLNFEHVTAFNYVYKVRLYTKFYLI